MTVSRRDEPTPAELRERLDELRRRERQLHALRDRQFACEAECIAAGVALRRRGAERLTLDAATAREIAAALDRRRGLEERLARVHEGTKEERDRLREAREALRLWLDAPQSGAGESTAGRMRKALLGVSLLVVVAALSVHLVLLVLLIPIAGAGSFLSWSGQDLAWRRMGARRRFEATRLARPERWEDPAVRERLAAIDALVAAREAWDAAGNGAKAGFDDRTGIEGESETGTGAEAGHSAGVGSRIEVAGRAGTGTDTGFGTRAETQTGTGAGTRCGSGAATGAGLEDHPRTLSARLDTENALLDDLLAGGGLTRADLDRDSERRIRELAEASRSRQELVEIEGRIGEARHAIDTLREDLYRYLARRGAASAAGGAHTDTLAAGLERLARDASRD